MCPLSQVLEDANHIFFSCSVARFAWSVVRQLLGCSLNPINFAQFYAIVSTFAGKIRRVLWMLFATLAWALWNVHNKLTLERKVLWTPAHIVFKKLSYCSFGSRQQDPKTKTEPSGKPAKTIPRRCRAI
jgi:hypothetical protein